MAPLIAPSASASLDAEITKIKEFVALLRREQTLLQAADTDALLPLIDQKTALSDALAAFGQARERELARLGLPAGRAGMNAWLEQHAALRPTWEALLTLAAEARELNLLNGKLVGLHLSKNQQAFNALMSASQRAMIYGPDGQQHLGRSGRILGTA